MEGNLAQGDGRGTDDLSRARELVAAWGRDALDHHKLAPDKQRFFADGGAAFLAFRQSAGAAVVLGDPVGAPGAVTECIEAFLGGCRRTGRRPVFVQTGGEFLDAYRRAGLSPVRIGATAGIDLAGFDTAAPRAKPLRHALRRARAAGLRPRHLPPPIPPLTMAQLREVNASWLTLPGRFERGFSVGRFDALSIGASPISLIESPGGPVVAFMNWIASPVEGEATVDLIRRRADAPPGALDALLAAVLLDARDRGFSRFDLGLAPLARIDPPFAHPAERVLAGIYRWGAEAWGHRGLYRWKAKFHPRWTPRYLVYRGGPLDFARAALAVRRVTRDVESPRPRPFANRACALENGDPRARREAS